MAGFRHWGRRALAFLWIAQGALGQSTLEPVWSYTAGNQGWFVRRVALGNHGTEGWMQTGPFVDRTRLLSATSDSPVAPVWEHSDPQTTFNHRVASAEDGSGYYTLHSEYDPAQAGLHRVLLRRYVSSSSNPVWSYLFPVRTNGSDRMDVLVSRDGQRVVGIVHNMYNGQTDVAVLQPSSSTPLRYASIQAYMPFNVAALSDDGRKLLLVSASRALVADVGTLQEDWGAFLFEQVTPALAVSADGNTIAFGATSGLRVYRRTAPNAFTLAWTRVGPGGSLVGAADISHDGSRLVAAWHTPGAYLTVHTETYDLPASLAQGTPVVLRSHTVTGAGPHQNAVADIETSDDGSITAVGTWGDQAGLAPEITVFGDQQSAPIAVYDLPGSVQDLDLAADGRRLLVASKEAHNNTLGGAGRLDMFDLGHGDLRLCGAPRIGTSVQFEVRGNAGQLAVLLVADDLAAQPILFPRMGYLRLERNQVQQAGTSVCDGTGKAVFGYVIPNGTDLIGRTLYFQGFKVGPRRLTRDWVQMSILP